MFAFAVSKYGDVMMRKTVLMIILFGVSLSAFAQENSKIVRLQGGLADIEWTVSSNLFYGLGGRATHLGSIVSTNEYDLSVSTNPAFLADLDQHIIQLGYRPPVRINLGSLFDIDHSIQSATDSAIRDYRDDTIDLVYPDVQARISQSDQFGAFVFGLPLVSDWGMALHHSRPLRLDLSALISAAAIKIDTELDMSDAADQVVFNSFLGGNLSSTLALSTIGFSTGYAISDHVSLGGSVNRSRVIIRTNGYIDVQGSMLYGGQENTFNDPNDNWHNDLTQSIDTDYDGHALSYQVAASYSSDPFYLAMVMDWNPDIRATGQLDLVSNTVPALNTDVLLGESDEEDAEILDPEKLNLSQLTFTKRVNQTSFPEMTIRYPSMLKLGAAYRWDHTAVHLDYAWGITPLSVVYGPDKVGIHPVHTVRLGLDIKSVQLGIGGAILKTLSEGAENLFAADQTFILPLVSAGTTLEFKRILLNMLLAANPTPLLSVTIAYRF
jgi:hypothetical protein